jgi:hypothetical protein
MEKGGMRRYGAEENGDPLYRFLARSGQTDPGRDGPANTADREWKTKDEK